MPRRLHSLAPLGLALIGTALLGGCYVDRTQVPMPTTYPYSEQRKMQATHHWEVLAAHEAERITRSARLRDRSLFVIDGESAEAAFSQGFGALLTSHLVANGATVRTDPINAALVDYQVQVVEHEDREFLRPPPGALTTLAASIAVATVPINHWSEPALALIPAAAAVDAFSGNWTGVTEEEVIITTRVIENNRVLYSSSNIYYINPEDEEHYRSPANAVKTFPVTDRW